MKLTLVFLLCFVAATYQQHHLRNYHFYEPRLAFYYPPLLSNQEFDFQQGSPDMDDEADYSSISSRTGDFPDAEARGPISRFGNENSKPQSRFFGMNNFISQLLNNNKNQYHLLPTITSIIHQTSTSTVTTSSITTSTVSTAPITFTSTILQTQTSAITTPLVKLCLPQYQFTNNLGGGGYSTTSCPPRKRRGMNIEENEAISFVPNPVQPLEITAESAVLMSSLRDSRNDDQPEIASSQQDLPISEGTSFNYRQKRQIIIVSTTVTVTTYPLVASTSTKTITNLVRDNGTLNCLPAGYNVCVPY